MKGIILLFVLLPLCAGQSQFSHRRIQGGGPPPPKFGRRPGGGFTHPNNPNNPGATGPRGKRPFNQWGPRPTTPPPQHPPHPNGNPPRNPPNNHNHPPPPPPPQSQQPHSNHHHPPSNQNPNYHAPLHTYPSPNGTHSTKQKITFTVTNRPSGLTAVNFKIQPLQQEQSNNGNHQHQHYKQDPKNNHYLHPITTPPPTIKPPTDPSYPNALYSMKNSVEDDVLSPPPVFYNPDKDVEMNKMHDLNRFSQPDPTYHQEDGGIGIDNSNIYLTSAPPPPITTPTPTTQDPLQRQESERKEVIKPPSLSDYIKSYLIPSSYIEERLSAPTHSESYIKKMLEGEEWGVSTEKVQEFGEEFYNRRNKEGAGAAAAGGIDYGQGPPYQRVESDDYRQSDFHARIDQHDQRHEESGYVRVHDHPHNRLSTQYSQDHRNNHPHPHPHHHPHPNDQEPIYNDHLQPQQSLHHPHYEQPQDHPPPHQFHPNPTPSPIYVVTEAEPIIEIIVQDSNHTLPPLPLPTYPPTPPPTPEPVHVFYVKYTENKHSPDINLEHPVPSVNIRGGGGYNEGGQQQQQQLGFGGGYGGLPPHPIEQVQNFNGPSYPQQEYEPHPLHHEPQFDPHLGNVEEGPPFDPQQFQYDPHRSLPQSQQQQQQSQSQPQNTTTTTLRTILDFGKESYTDTKLSVAFDKDGYENLPPELKSDVPHPQHQLPSDVPTHLKQQLINSGILSNAEVQVVNFDNFFGGSGGGGE